MSEAKKWVQHISGQGEKWEVSQGYQAGEPYEWQVIDPVSCGMNFHYLPKSEYVPCDPPEVWEDVTDECKVSPLAGSELSHGDMKIYLPMGYRFRKVTCDDMIHEYLKHAFIVERRKA